MTSVNLRQQKLEQQVRDLLLDMNIIQIGLGVNSGEVRCALPFY